MARRVQTTVAFRSEPDAGAGSTIFGRLAADTPLEILEVLAGGAYETPNGSREDWAGVIVEGTEGFVAAFYVEADVRRFRVSDHVATRLRVRNQPDPSAEVEIHIGRGTVVTFRRAVTGEQYPFEGQPRADWIAIESLGRDGYVAAAFVEPVEAPAAPSAAPAGASTATTLNAILLEFDPAGASDSTARQDRLPHQGIHGVRASETMAQTHLARVSALKDSFLAAALEEALLPALLAAIASRESRGGAALDGRGFGDGGHGYGVMQIDDRSWSADMSEGPDGLAHIHHFSPDSCWSNDDLQ